MKLQGPPTKSRAVAWLTAPAHRPNRVPSLPLQSTVFPGEWVRACSGTGDFGCPNCTCCLAAVATSGTSTGAPCADLGQVPVINAISKQDLCWVGGQQCSPLAYHGPSGLVPAFSHAQATGALLLVLCLLNPSSKKQQGVANFIQSPSLRCHLVANQT